MCTANHNTTDIRNIASGISSVKHFTLDHNLNRVFNLIVFNFENLNVKKYITVERIIKYDNLPKGRVIS